MYVSVDGLWISARGLHLGPNGLTRSISGCLLPEDRKDFFGRCDPFERGFLAEFGWKLGFNQHPQRLGDQNLVAARLGADSRGLLHGLAEEVVTVGHRLSGIKADAHMKWLVAGKVEGLETDLDGSCAAHTGLGLVKGGHDPVARMFDLAPAHIAQRAADDLVMRPHELDRFHIAHPRGHGG